MVSNLQGPTKMERTLRILKIVYKNCISRVYEFPNLQDHFGTKMAMTRFSTSLPVVVYLLSCKLNVHPKAKPKPGPKVPYHISQIFEVERMLFCAWTKFGNTAQREQKAKTHPILKSIRVIRRLRFIVYFMPGSPTRYLVCVPYGRKLVDVTVMGMVVWKHRSFLLCIVRCGVDILRLNVHRVSMVGHGFVRIFRSGGFISFESEMMGISFVIRN